MAEPAAGGGPRSERPPRLIFPILLVIAGVVAFLANAGFFPSDWGWRLLQLWPLILVVIGLELLVGATLRGRGAWVVSPLLALAVAAAALAWIIAGPAVIVGGGGTLDLRGPAAVPSQAKLAVAAAGTDLHVTTVSGGALYSGTMVGGAGQQPKATWSQASGVLSLSFDHGVPFWGGNGRSSIDVALNSGAAWALDVSGAGVNGTVDLGAVQTPSVNVAGAGTNLTITLGPGSGTVPVDVSGAGVSITFRIPASGGVKIDASGLGSSIDYGDQHLAGFGSQQYTSSNWTSAADRFDFSVSGVGSHVTIEAVQ